MRVLTLTANLLAETTYTLASWTEGATQRARTEAFQVGGKGVNVAKMLGRLGVPSAALCFPGGATGARCEAWLRAAGLPFIAFPTESETRTGAVVRAPGRAETTFLGAENIVDPESIRRCAAFLDAEPAGNVLVVGGSIPAWPEPKWEPLRRAIERWIGCGLIAVDTYGEPLRWFAGRAVDLVKINRREFAGLLGRDPASPIDDAAMPALLDDAARTHRAVRWVVTDGPGRVWHRDREGLAGSRMPPRVDEVSPTGSGDVLLAALVWGMAARRMDLAAALETALPIAAANAAHPGVADFDLAPFASIFGGLP